MLILADGRVGTGVSAVRILNVGTAHPGTAWSTARQPPYRTQHHSIQLVNSGSGAVEVDGVWQEFRRDDLVLVPGQHWLRRRGDAGLSLRYLGFAVEPVAVDIRLGSCPRALVFPATDQPIIAQGLATATLHQGLLSTVQTQAALHTAIALLLATSAATETNPSDPAVLRARTFIEAHYLASPSLTAIAHASGRSAHYLHLLFTRAMGCSPSAYALRLRLRDAQMLLLGGTMPVREVAERCGYSDAFHFSRVFQRACGVSPRGFRRRFEYVA